MCLYAGQYWGKLRCVMCNVKVREGVGQGDFSVEKERTELFYCYYSISPLTSVYYWYDGKWRTCFRWKPIKFCLNKGMLLNWWVKCIIKPFILRSPTNHAAPWNNISPPLSIILPFSPCLVSSSFSVPSCLWSMSFPPWHRCCPHEI